jgi:transcriptional regulator with XRE-family HTH domain
MVCQASSMDETAAWVEVGRRIREAREALRPKISARKAADLAQMGRTYWQDIERGFRLDGGRFNPSDEKLEAAALVVGLDPAPLFDLVGRTYEPTNPSGPASFPLPTEAVLAAMLEELRAIREALDPGTPPSGGGPQSGRHGARPGSRPDVQDRPSARQQKAQ